MLRKFVLLFSGILLSFFVFIGFSFNASASAVNTISGSWSGFDYTTHSFYFLTPYKPEKFSHNFVKATPYSFACASGFEYGIVFGNMPSSVALNTVAGVYGSASVTYYIMYNGEKYIIPSSSGYTSMLQLGQPVNGQFSFVLYAEVVFSGYNIYDNKASITFTVHVPDLPYVIYYWKPEVSGSGNTNDYLNDINQETKKQTDIMQENNQKIDDMMNGYNPSVGGDINGQLSNGLNEFDKVQGDLFNTAVDGMKDFKPGDVSMDVLDGNLLSSIWFVTTLLQAVYLSSGGLVGFGVIASVAFAVAFSAMVVGLYRYYIK